jgi:DNA repair protein RadD
MYSVHYKKNASADTPRTLRVDYAIGFHQFKSEWVCPEHSGYAREKFVKWWKDRAALGCAVPKTADEAVDLANRGCLTKVVGIKVKTIAGEKYDRITSYTFDENRAILEPGANDDFGEDFEFHSNSPADLGVRKDWDVDLDDAIPF